MSSSQLKYDTAARLNSTSTLPYVPSASSTTASQSAGSSRWHGCVETISPPAPRTISTVASAGSTVTSQPTTDAPSRANVSAVSRPMLPPVPVTTHTLPSSLPDPWLCTGIGSWRGCQAFESWNSLVVT